MSGPGLGAAVALPAAAAGEDVPAAVRRGRRREALLAPALLLPSLGVFGVFVFYPLVRTVELGLYRSDPFGLRTSFVGLDQYADVLASARFRSSLATTVAFALLTVPPGLAAGLALALLANQRLRAMAFFRVVFSSTVATSVAVASVMWLTLLNPSVGLVNYGLRAVGAEPVAWLQDPDRALLAVSFATVWQNLGVTFVVLLAGLQSVPADLLEAAEVDGAGPWARLRHVTLPLLSPTLAFVAVVLTILAFESFGQIDLLTQGGPVDRTNVVVYSIYREARRNSNPSGAAAQAVVLFVVVLVLSLVQFFLLERRVHYAGGGADGADARA